MLFDLRGRGRRRTVQVIYLSLAILMGGGLVLFGIGGATSGGLVDAITGNSDSSTDTSVYEERIDKLEKQIKLNPKAAQAWADLARAQVQQASIVGYEESTGSYNRKGIEGLQAAARSWDRYLDLGPKKADGGVASLMVQAYGPAALNDPQQAARALDVVIQSRGPSAALYTQLAVLHYAAGDLRRSVIAERQALKRTPERRRKLARARLAAQRKEIDSSRLGSATGSEGGDIEIDPQTTTKTSK